MGEFTIIPAGAFSLRELGTFGFGQRYDTAFDGTMRLAFCLDDLRTHAGVGVTQDGAGELRCAVTGPAGANVAGLDVAAVRAQVARMLSVDVDAAGYEAVGARDPVVAQLLAAAPGLRPPLFHSPYEAAVWCVLSVRWSGRQAAAVRDRLAVAHGAVVEVAGRSMPAFPTPEQLLAVEGFPGIPPVKLERLHGVARAALDGALAPAALRAADPAEAQAGLRSIPGIGAFSAALIVIRACGATDVLPDREPRLAANVGRLYGLGAPATPAQLAEIGAAWRPFRTWVAVLVRAAADRLPEAPEVPLAC